MLKEIRKIKLKTDNLQSEGLLFIPDKSESHYCGIFTHGYTSHKGSILTWAQKTIDLGIPCIIFDLPGHYLGSFNEVPDLKTFQIEAANLFEESFQTAKNVIPRIETCIAGGHSLGALLALLKSFDSEHIEHLICVGLGSLKSEKPHIFTTPFFKDTMHLRSQLVSPSIHPNLILPWISKKKEGFLTKNKEIHLIGGKDDIIIGGENGIKNMADRLKKHNDVDTHIFPKLPHHLPENAGLYIKNIIKNIVK